MIDIKFIKENLEKVKLLVESKQLDRKKVDELVNSYDEWTKTLKNFEHLRQKRNEIAKQGKFSEEGKELKDKLKTAEITNFKAWEKYKDLEDHFPNLPKSDVKVGKDESGNELVHKKGVVPTHMFKTRDHLELGEMLDIIDVKRAAKVSGTRFAYLKNEGALLEFALIQFAMEVLTKEGFIPIVPPVLINREITTGLGYWDAPKDQKTGLTGNEDYYYLSDRDEKKEMYLVGTAEHSIVPMHKDEIFEKKDLPRRYVAFSSAFRREAGAYGKDTRGILRVHQFDKVEMVSFVTEENDDKEHEYLLSLEEKLFQMLEIPYQVVKMYTGDLGFPIARKYDIEAWMPGQNKYREVTSTSTTTDFQARRLNIKYQDGNEKKYVHVLNGTAFAIGRTLIAILENYQQEDGSVIIPKVLRKYINNLEKIMPKK